MANLAYGSSGSDVRKLQEQLKAAGYNIAADGVFGKETQNAVRQYQQSKGLVADGIAGSQTMGALDGNYGGRTSTGGSGYNNSGLTTDQIVEMQNYYGTKADGLWGQNSTAAAGGLNAQQAWQQYQQQQNQQQNQQQTQQQYQQQETMLPSVMGFEDFYDRMGGAEYEQKIQEAINASVQRAVDAYNAQRVDTEQDASEMARQAYIAKLLGEKNMAQRLAASGYAGGMAESAMLESEANYQNQLAEIQRERQRALDEIQRAIDNARLTGDMEMAEQMTAYMQNAQNYYNDYVARVQEQAWAEEQTSREALDEAAKQQQAQDKVNITAAGNVMSPLVEDPSGGITAQTPSFSNIKRSISGALQTGNPTLAATLVTQVWSSANEAQRQELRNLMNAAGYNIAG